jgi:hypothetical protein
MKKFLKMLGLASARDLAEAEAEIEAATAAEAEAWEQVKLAKAATAAQVEDVWAPPALVEEASAEAEAEVEASASALALAEAKANLEKVSQANAKAEAEADLLREVSEVNSLTFNLLAKMERENLLPAQMEQRRKDAEKENTSIQEVLNDLGI